MRRWRAALVEVLLAAVCVWQSAKWRDLTKREQRAAAAALRKHDELQTKQVQRLRDELGARLRAESQRVLKLQQASMRMWLRVGCAATV